MKVPAVLDDYEGTLAELQFTSIPNESGVYVSIYPYSGESFQQSLREAISYLNLTDYASHNLILATGHINNDQGSIDGPSAGVAITLMLESLTKNKTLRDDLTITGGIDGDGNVQPVGGLWEKYLGAKKGGLKGILISPMDDLSRVGLCLLYNEYGLPVYEYSDYETAKRYFFSNDSLVYYLNFSEYSTENLSDLRSVSPGPIKDSVSNMLDLGDRLVARSECSSIKESYSLLLDDARVLLDKGYVYSAGNKIFLALPTLKLSAGLPNSDSLNVDYTILENCLDNVNNSLRTCGDPMYYSQAELRYFWALNSFESVNLSKYHSISRNMYDELTLTRGLLWCGLAQDILSQCPIGAINNTKFKPVVDRYLYDLESNLDSKKAYIAYSKGLYGASLMEIAYSKSDVPAPIMNASHLWTIMLLDHSKYLNFTNSSSYESVRNLALWMEFLVNQTENNSGYCECPSNVVVEEPIKGGYLGDFLMPALIVLGILCVMLYKSPLCKC